MNLIDHEKTCRITDESNYTFSYEFADRFYMCEKLLAPSLLLTLSFTIQCFSGSSFLSRCVEARQSWWSVFYSFFYIIGESTVYQEKFYKKGLGVLKLKMSVICQAGL